MNVPVHRVLLIGLLAMVTTQAAVAESRTYPDGHGGQVTFPQGDLSFADEVVHYDNGVEKPVESRRKTRNALGIPDFADDRGYVTLGCGGTLVLKFNDNRLIDIAGPNLYVFEIGPDVEATALAISADGEDWVRIGRIEGGKADVDIAPYVDANQSFRYVKLVDLRSGCGGETPGADIDALGAIGSLRHIALDSSVLFETAKYELKPEASRAIDEAVAGIDPGRLQAVRVAGFTDSVGSAQSNLVLSRNRARSVADYLIAEAGFPVDKVHVEAHGESNPVASNATTKGRARNRRVELGIRALADKTETDGTRIEILGVWRSDSNRLTVLRTVDGAMRGTYTRDGGRIRGRFTSDTVFEGFWIEDDSKRTCDTGKDGSKHWGRLRIEFQSADRDAYDAQWAYCGEQGWHGHWPHGKRVL